MKRTITIEFTLEREIDMENITGKIEDVMVRIRTVPFVKDVLQRPVQKVVDAQFPFG